MTNGASAASLAIDGGPRFRTYPWPKRAHFGEAEKAAVVRLFDQAIVSGDGIGYDGEEERAYCSEFAAFHGGGFADAVSSGTAALYVALRALEIEPFTEVIVPPVTDPGGVMAVPLLNCVPIVADSAPDSLNMGAEQIADRITERTSAIVVAHIAGIPADMDAIMELAGRHNLPVVEDCAQAHGALYKGRMVGTMGTAGIFSTMFTKHHTTGSQGGVVYTRDEALYARIRICSDRGKPFGGEIDWRTTNDCNLVATLNFNLGDLPAAIGRVQLRRLPEFLAGRRRIVRGLAQGCGLLRAVSINVGPSDTQGAFWFVPIRLDLAKLRVGMEQFAAALSAEGLPIGMNTLELFTRAPWYRQRAVFGTSGLPWTSPLYFGDPDQVYPVPNVIETSQNHIRLDVNERYTDADVADILAILKRVEDAYAL